MDITSTCELTFARLPDISPDQIMAHMSDACVTPHMPLLTVEWNRNSVTEFVATKERCWDRDGLGHWTILCDGIYGSSE